VAIDPIFIAVGLRQHCKQIYIFITVRLLYDVTKISPGLLHDLTKVSPISPGLHYNLAKFSPGLHYDLAKILPKSRHSCSTISSRLAGLLYDLATVALRCPQDSQDFYTISLQLHYDVPKTRRIAIRSRHSCTRMSSPRLAELLCDITTVVLRCPHDSPRGC
jgi:hypothetical protein